MSAAPLRWTAGGRTDARRRPDGEESHNYDHLLLDTDLGLCMVLDSGGNWEGPDRRAVRAAEVIQQVVRDGLATTPPQVLAERAFRLAGETLRAELDEYGSYGTTMVVLLLLCSDQAHVSWLGSSMGYRLSGNDIEAITWPHTVLNDAIRSGQLTQEEARCQNPIFARVYCRYVGMCPFPEPLEVISFTPQRGERVILTTDGVHDVLSPADLLAACRLHPEPQACADRLVALARERGSRDNCTCLVIAFG